MKTNVLFVSGIPDNDKIQVKKTHPNGDILRYVYTGLSEFFLYLDPPNWNRLPLLIDSREFPLQFDPATHCIINEIAEADSHSQTLDYLERLLQKHPQIPVFNHPQQVRMTRRDRVYKALKDIPHLCVPKTIRFQPEHLNDILDCMQSHDMNYPLILKGAGMHAGVNTLRFDNLEQLKEGLYPMALDGSSYYLIQFHDTSHNGIFSKFRLVMVNGKVYPSHLRYADHWMVHYYSGKHFMAKHPEYFENEKAFLTDYTAIMPRHFNGVMEAIYQRIPIDYTGLDFTLHPETGDILLFELNPNMLVLPVDPPYEPHDVKSAQAIQQAIQQRIQCIQQDSKGRLS